MTAPDAKHMEARGIRVKPLVWGPHPLHGDSDLAIADVEFQQRYHAQRDPWAATYIVYLYARPPISDSTLWWGSRGHETLEDAKAAAQADYERRVLACVEAA